MSSQRFCPNCGSPLAPGQHFCSNCGFTLEAGSGDPTARAEGSGQSYTPGAPPPEDATVLPVAPPPPPEGSSQQPYSYYAPQATPPVPPMQQSAQQPVPSYAKPQKDSSRKVLGQIGCGVFAIILAVLLVCGGASYFVYRAVVNAANSVPTDTTQNGNAPGSSSQNGSSPTAIAALTAQINQTVTYASVDTTILSVQEASRFTDDTNTSSNAPVTLRINIKEHNTSSTNTAFLNYNSNYLLVLPDKSTVAVSNSQVSDVINQVVQRNNWLDFPLTKSIPISQLTLQIGAATEAQISVPLTGKADVSAYQTKTIAPNTTIQYEGLTWKLTQVTSSLSHKATQAKTGMRYITLSFTLDNPSSNTVFPNSNNYLRLQLGSTTNSETDDTLPTDLSPSTTNSTGTVTFEMPQGSGTFTLSFLAQPNASPPASQQTTTFQI